MDFNNGGYKFSPLRKSSALINFIAHVLEKQRLHKITAQGYKDAFRDENGRIYFTMLRELNETIKSRGEKLVIVLFPLLYNFKNYIFKDIHLKIADFCSKENIFLLDLLSSFSQYKAKELWANPTDHHPNEIAHDIAADVLYKFLQQNKILDRMFDN
ncbi:MAG: hypothetical protein KJ569_07860 [Candidatus Omnitrophica bacterium]|nr:hypothetical protein [Candidatus Omnitrophota bacterium]MBU1811392.1 hypothetical protein [Candidatus Omnitrophota bacterium]